LSWLGGQRLRQSSLAVKPAFLRSPSQKEFLPSTETPVGLGEPATTAVAPAIANAIIAASGARVRDLPIRPEAVRQALAHQT
jgi:CO/xanthine dehydrogenase Mo-binding subunit